MNVRINVDKNACYLNGHEPSYFLKFTWLKGSSMHELYGVSKRHWPPKSEIMKGQSKSSRIPQKKLYAVLEPQTLKQAPHRISILSLLLRFGYQKTFLFGHSTGYSK